MSQKYVADGAWLTCTDGKMMQKLKVDSQTTIYMHGKLAATEKDRTGENFNCLKMALAAAIIGAVIAAAVIAATVATGGAFIGVMAAASSIGCAALGGAVVGTAMSFIPCICSLLTKPNNWTEVHSKVYFSGKRALLENATLPCMLGGMVSILKTSVKTAIEMAMLSEDVYSDIPNVPPPEGWTAPSYEDYPDGLKDPKLWIDGKSSFYARLYKGPNGEYAVVMRGTKEGIDWEHNLKQGVGLKDEQYEQAFTLAKELKKYLPADKTTIAGHSLGGGLAALAGAETHFPTYTFNAAGVHERTLKNKGMTIDDTKHIQAIGSDDDPLSIIQDNRELIGSAAFRYLGKVGKFVGASVDLDGALPHAAGQRIGLDTDVSRLDPLKGHSLPPLIDALKKEQGQNPDIHVIAETK